MTHKQYADNAVNHLSRVASAWKGIKGQGQAPYQPGGTPQSASAVNGEALAQALAEYLKTNNSTTQALAIRITDLASRYKQRAA
jgi:hypothetical protein